MIFLPLSLVSITLRALPYPVSSFSVVTAFRFARFATVEAPVCCVLSEALTSGSWQPSIKSLNIMVIHFILKAQMKYIGLDTNVFLIPLQQRMSMLTPSFHSPYPGGNAVKARLDEKLQEYPVTS